MKRLFSALAALSAALGVVTIMVVHPAPMLSSPIAIPAREVRYLTSVNDLKSALQSGERLYVIGAPADVSDYVRAVQRTPNLVLVVVERSSNHDADAEVLVKALQNSDLLRRVIIDRFTGIPNGVGAVRFDRIEDGKGRMDIHTAPRLRQVGFANTAVTKRYAEVRKNGTSVAEALTEVIAQANRAVDTDNQATIASAATFIANTRQAIRGLSSQITQSGFVPVGYSEAMPGEWETRLAEAEAILMRATSLDSVNQARASAQAVAKDISRYQELVNRELGGRALRQLAGRGILGLVVLATILSAALTAQLRRTARAEVEAKKEDIDRALTEVMSLLEQSTFVVVNATGRQKREAEALSVLNDRLLEQVVALQKFLLAAAQVLDARGLGWVYHHLVPVGARYVAALATGEATLTVSRQEIENLLRTTGGKLNADYELRIGNAEDRQLSITDLIGAIEQTFPEAKALYTRLSEADATLASGIEELEARANALEAKATALTGDSRRLFSGEPIVEFIVRSAEHPEGGHIALAKQARAANDALGGVESHLKPAARMIADGERALQVLAYGRDTLVPAMQRTIDLLGAPGSGITTNWVAEAVHTESENLSELIQRAPFEPIEEGIGKVRDVLETLIADFADAIRLNERRLTSWPTMLDDASARVAQGQATVFERLSSLGLFVSGEPDDLLREPGASPKELLDAIRHEFDEVFTDLNEGDLKRARAAEAQVAACFTGVDQLVTQSEQRSREYNAKSLRLADAIETSRAIRGQLVGAVRAAAVLYSLRSQERACQEVLGDSESLGAMADKATGKTGAAHQIGDSAAREMQRGFVLTAGAAVDEAQQRADSALGILTGLPRAIALLEAKVVEARAEFGSGNEQCHSLSKKARQSGVRTATKRALEEVSTSITTIERSIASAPYEALDSLTGYRKRLKEIDRAIDNDIRLADEVAATLSRAHELERTAQSALSTAERTTFSYATVNLGRANTAWGAYSSASSSATEALGREDYEAAIAKAQSAYREVSSVEQLASEAVTAAKRDHDASVASYSSTEDRGGYADYTSVSDYGGGADYSSVSD